MNPDNERHWTYFKNDFVSTWKDDSLLEDAQFKLSALSMKKDMPLHEYISTFNALITELGWDRNHQGTVRAFRMGLKSWLATAILRKDNCPADDDLDGWQEAARKEVVKAKRIRQEAGGFGRGGLTVRENMFQQFFKDHPIPKKAPRDPDAMDVDVIDTKPKERTQKPAGRFQQLSPEELKKLRTEGRCFKCKKQGHMSKNCPDRKGTSQKPSAKVVEATEESTDDDKDETQSQTSTKVGSTKGKGKLMAQINALTIEEKEELFDKLISEGF
jgi:Retrotransposon gag protein/Zinc knuckle